jgi:hypothetical protein
MRKCRCYCPQMVARGKRGQFICLCGGEFGFELAALEPSMRPEHRRLLRHIDELNPKLRRIA